MFWHKIELVKREPIGSMGALIRNSGMWRNRANYLYALFIYFFSLSLNSFRFQLLFMQGVCQQIMASMNECGVSGDVSEDVYVLYIV